MSRLSRLNYVPSGRKPDDWQRALLRHLEVLDGICQEHGIRYSLAFGGLLGAVRHRGFIPWDNDVDVVMDEANYNRFVEVYKQGLFPEGFVMADRSTEDDYQLLFGRFIDTNTSCPLGTSSYNGGAHGLFIDVFILFPLPDDPAAQEEAVTLFLVWEQLVCRAKRRYKYRTPAFFRTYARFDAIARESGRDAAIAQAEAEFRALCPRFEDSHTCLHGSGGMFNGFGRLRTAWFTDPVKMPFETAELYAPSDAFGFLEHRYGGGWRMLPRDQKFKAYSCANLNIPGEVLTRDYMQGIDRDRAVADLAARTDAQMAESMALWAEEYDQYCALAKLNADAIGTRAMRTDAVIGMSVAGMARITRTEARAALDQLAEVEGLLDCKELKNWHIMAPLPERVLSCVLWMRLIAYDEYWAVDKVIRSYREDPERNVFAPSEYNRRIEVVLDACTRLYCAIDAGDDAEIRAQADLLARECPASIHAYVAGAYALRDDAAACLSYIDLIPAEYDVSSGYVELLRCQMLCSLPERRDEGAEALRRLMETTENGMVLLAAGDFAEAEGLGIGRVVAQSREGAAPCERSVEPAKLGTFADFGAERRMKALIQQADASAKLRSEAAREAAVYDKRIDRYNAIRRLTSDRFYVWERMYPRKEIIREAVAEGTTDAVRKVAQVYLNALYRVYDRDGDGLFIDLESLDAVLPVLEEDRGLQFVLSFLEAIPDYHCEDLDAQLKRLGVKHPYFEEGWVAEPKRKKKRAK